ITAAAATALVASFTLNNGLLIWPLGWLLLWLGRGPLRRPLWRVGRRVPRPSVGGGPSRATWAMGAAIAAALAIVMRARIAFWRQWDRHERVVGCLALFALMSAAAVFAGRRALHRDYAVEPRYTSFTALLPVALYYHGLRRRGEGR